MTRFTAYFMNHSDRATAGNSAAAGTSCARHTAFFMDAALCAASIFVIIILASLLLAGLGVSIIIAVCVLSVLGLVVRMLPNCLEKANRVS